MGTVTDLAESGKKFCGILLVPSLAFIDVKKYAAHPWVGHKRVPQINF
jgi:hypothetical protein